MIFLNNSVLEVSRKAFLNNVKAVEDYISNKASVMPVIKANGYGTYINRCLEIINEFKIVAVATVDEGVELRKLGYEKEIFVFVFVVYTFFNVEKKNAPIPSANFNVILPVKPSVIITSHGELGISLDSMFPTKFICLFSFNKFFSSANLMSLS